MLFANLWYVFRTFINIYNWPLQPCEGYGLVSHTTHVVCFNFIREWRNLQFNVVSERQIFEKLYNSRFIYSQRFIVQKSAEEIFFHISFLIRTRAMSNKQPIRFKTVVVFKKAITKTTSQPLLTLSLQPNKQ